MSFRHLWGKAKRSQLLDEAERRLTPEYQELHPASNSDCLFSPALLKAVSVVATFAGTVPGFFSWREDEP